MFNRIVARMINRLAMKTSLFVCCLILFHVAEIQQAFSQSAESITYPGFKPAYVRALESLKATSQGTPQNALYKITNESIELKHLAQLFSDDEKQPHPEVQSDSLSATLNLGELSSIRIPNSNSKTPSDLPCVHKIRVPDLKSEQLFKD
ncbi:hypothetical protein JXJ21_15035 [candidate division KSB1 bacterium]|nr:hypothetical protein [candidate division KSB1 bacterium]